MAYCKIEQITTTIKSTESEIDYFRKLLASLDRHGLIACFWRAQGDLNPTLKSLRARQ
jgi:hypothetical protein